MQPQFTYQYLQEQFEDVISHGYNVITCEDKVVGNNATIGMGAVVVKDVPEGETWHGNPAKAHHY